MWKQGVRNQLSYELKSRARKIKLASTGRKQKPYRYRSPQFIQLKQLKEERTKSENECERLNKLLDESLSTLKQLEKEARQLESTNSKLENVLGQAEKDHQRLLEELKAKEGNVMVTNKKIDQMGEEENELKEKIVKLEKECEKSKGEYQELCQAL